MEPLSTHAKRLTFLSAAEPRPPKREELNPLDKVGVWLERLLEKLFNRWGRFCAENPVPVIVFSLAIAIAMCVGVQRLKV